MTELTEVATFWEPVLGSLSDGNKVLSLLLRSWGCRGSMSAECLGPHCFLFDQLAEFCQVSRVESHAVCSLSGIQTREGKTDRQTPSSHNCPSSSWHLGHLRNTAGICSHSKQVFLRVSVTTRTHQSLRPKWPSVEIIIPVQTHKRWAKSVCHSFVHSSLLSFVLMGGWHLRVLEF